jgi:hypothetical protein
MQIILDRKEYEQLRPNALRDALIDKIKLRLHTGGDWHATVMDIQSEIEEYDRAVVRAEREDTFRLWPATPQD